MTQYKVSYTSRVVSCKSCNGKLVKGELRVDRGKQGAYHAACLFDNLVEKGCKVNLSMLSDFLGSNDLLPSDQVILQGHINRYILRKNSQNGNSTPTSTIALSTTNSTPINTNTDPLPTLNNSNNDSLSTSSNPSSTPSTSTSTNLPSQGVKRTAPFPPPIVISDSESEPPTPPRKAVRVSPIQQPTLPNLLEGVNIPPGPPRTYDECAVCLDQPLHPVTLPCSHIFCYLCAKGLTRQAGSLATCSLCRKDIPEGYLESAQVLAKASLDLDDTLETQQGDKQGWQWFYEGRNGWWKFEERNNEELEENYSLGQKVFETMICGNLYIIDFQAMEQFQKGYPNRKRKIKRDLKTSYCKGVAGLQKRKLNL